MTSTHTNADFPDTRWTLIEAVNQRDHPFREDALQQLARTYWRPVYAFLVKSGKSHEDAADITQGYFAEIILAKDIFAQADQSRGRLRSLVLVSLKNFLVDEFRQHKGEHENRFLDISDLGHDERMSYNDDGEPDRIFDRRWALAVLQETMRRCEAQFRRNGKPEFWKAFELRDVRPSVSMTPPPPYEQVAKEACIPTAEQATYAVRTVRKRMVAMLRQIAVETADGPEDQQSEYDHVVALLS
jgi:DNA-directed RNA polymerase specialized sigma24 family protein